MKMLRIKLSGLCASISVVLLSIVLVSASTVVVDSPFGKIRGVWKTVNESGQSYLSFKGIPYAKPPVEDLRFAKPQPHPNIEGIFDATKDDNIVCPHPDMMNFGITDATEDCLILNIQVKDINSFDSLRKVIIFIHGGSFQFGTSDIHDGKSFVISQDVIVVTINYRLGILGFLSTENEASPGNYGLWDQTLAIQWVKDNIRAFGGDPDDITITGESAGGASVGYQSISPYAKGLFTKAYPSSGFVSSVFARSINAQSHALDFARSVGCWEGEIDFKVDVKKCREIMECLKKVSLPEITSFEALDDTKTQFFPVVDGEFVPDVPVKLLKDDEYLESVGFFDRSYLLTFNNKEVSVFVIAEVLAKMSLSMKNTSLSQKQIESGLLDFYRNVTDLQLISRLGESVARDKRIVDKILDFYEKRYLKENVYIQLFIDVNILIPALDFLMAASRRETCRSYLLYFNHFPKFMTGPLKGTPHEGELPYWLDYDLNIIKESMNGDVNPEIFDDDDMELKRMFSSIVGEFMRSGSPGLALNNALHSGWPKYDVSTSHYLNFNLKPSIGNFFDKERQDFWFKTVPCLVNTPVQSRTVIVDTPFGKIKGIKKTDADTGLCYLSFKGIPYAKPPVGNLRFAKPQPHPGINGVFDASKETKIICPQTNLGTLNIQEDCLVLNIQTKDLNPSDGLRKVIVFIHGGGFNFGSSVLYESKSFVISQDVIVVTINYRLGILGFLSTENEASPGNYGLWDQTLAIQWVKDNIRAFGGDPDDITIAGESAGGASVGYQSLSPYTNGLFTKAYMQSGTATMVGARSVNSQSHALILAKSIGCWERDVDNEISVQESKTIVDCLRRAPLSSITEFDASVLRGISFAPVIDHDFVPDNPAKLLQNEHYLELIGFFDHSYLIAINNNEKSFVENIMMQVKHTIYSNNRTSEEERESSFEAVLAATKEMFLGPQLREYAAFDKNTVSMIEDFYKRRFWKDQVIFEMISDSSFFTPSLDFLAVASRRKSCSSYFLYFDHFPDFMKGGVRGIPHIVDLMYWFDIDVDSMKKMTNMGLKGEFTDVDLDLKRSFSSIVGDFIKSGDPGLTLKNTLPSCWPKYDVTNANYLNFNSKPWVSSFLEKEKQDLWFDIVPSMTKRKKSLDHDEL